MQLKTILRERSDDAGHGLSRDYFLGVALEVLDSRFGHADHLLEHPDLSSNGKRALASIFGLG
jgi:hypothetical protein